MSDWNGKRILVIGAARQGLALARYLSRHGARVTMNDQRSAETLSQARASLAGLSIEWTLGGHPFELLDGKDLVCLSGGIPLTLPIVAEASRRGIPLSNDTQIFLEAAPCKTIGITGSAGKTTTTTLVGLMAKTAFPAVPAGASAASEPIPAVYVGGNIGDPLINYVDEMKKEDLAILEISSFQLEQMTISPHVAAILNITPNHLDRHGTMEAYTAAKQRLLDFQSDQDIAVLGRDDPGAWALQNQVHGHLLSFGADPLPEGLQGTVLRNGLLHLVEKNGEWPLMPQAGILLRGAHNVQNILAAFAIGHAAGLPLDALRAAVETFRGVPHRLELVRELHGVRWYNDSIATAPERSMAAVRSFEEPIVLLLGGRDKDLPWDDLASLIHQRVDHVILFGEAAGKIEAALARSSGGRPYSQERCARLQEAVQAAARTADKGDVVLLSPGGTSFDEFRDFEERGERFRTWVLELS